MMEWENGRRKAKWANLVVGRIRTSKNASEANKNVRKGKQHGR
jgi:hypothetical protein